MRGGIHIDQPDNATKVSKVLVGGMRKNSNCMRKIYMTVHRCKWSVVYDVFTTVHSLFGRAQTEGYHKIIPLTGLNY